MLGLSPAEQNAIMGLRQNQQQIENKSINDIIDAVQRSQSVQAATRQQEKAMNLSERKFLHKRKLDNFKNIFELKKARIADSKLNIAKKNAMIKDLTQRSLERWQDAQIEYNEDVRGIKTEVFEDPDGVNRVYFVKGSEKIGDAIRTANTKDLSKSDKDSAKNLYKVQQELDNITMDSKGNAIITPIENFKRLRTYARTLGNDVKVIDLPAIDEGIADLESGPMRIPFIVNDVDTEITENQIRDTLENKYGWRLNDIDQAIEYLKATAPEDYEVNIGETDDQF